MLFQFLCKHAVDVEGVRDQLVACTAQVDVVTAMLRQYGKEAGSSELQDTWRKAGLSILSYVPEVRPVNIIILHCIVSCDATIFSDVASIHSFC